MDSKDHDLIVELSAKMTQLCTSVKKTDESNIKAHDKILRKIDANLELTDKWVSGVHDRIDEQLKEKASQVNKCHETFLHSKTFYWVTGFIIAGILTLWGAYAVFDERTDRIESTIEKVHPDVRFSR